MENAQLTKLEAEIWLAELKKRVITALVRRMELEQILQGKQPIRL